MQRMNSNSFHRNDGIVSTGGTNNGNSNSNISAISTSSLEAKIQTVAATLRQKRDEAHRTQQLALERLRLVRQEADALQGTVNDLQNKLETIQNQAGGSSRAKDELEKLYKDVDMLAKEVCMSLGTFLATGNRTSVRFFYAPSGLLTLSFFIFGCDTYDGLSLLFFSKGYISTSRID
jgi:hypothetical protein